MDLFEAITTRHMCRNFDTVRIVPEDVINKIAQAGIKAPSAGGLKDQRFMIVSEPEEKKTLAQSAPNQRFDLADASAIIVVCSDLAPVEEKYGKRGKDLYAPQNCAAAVQNMLLASTALGIGACWVGAFDEKVVKKAMELPSHWRPMVLVPVGYKLVEKK